MKRILSVVLLLLAVVGGLLLCDRATRRDDAERKFGSFFSEKQDIDVFFMGTSHVLDGVTPMELWRDYGISAYNMATSSETLGMTEQILKLCIERISRKSRSSTYITSINRTIWNGRTATATCFSTRCRCLRPSLTPCAPSCPKANGLNL